MAVGDRRKGMKVSKVNQEVLVGRSMIDMPSLMYKARYRCDWGKGDFTEADSIYCYLSHDLSINWMVKDLGLQKKRIKKGTVTEICDVGRSIAKMTEIKQWKITKEI